MFADHDQPLLRRPTILAHLAIPNARLVHLAFAAKAMPGLGVGHQVRLCLRPSKGWEKPTAMNGTGVGLVKRFWSAVVDGRAGDPLDKRMARMEDRLDARMGRMEEKLDTTRVQLREEIGTTRAELKEENARRGQEGRIRGQAPADRDAHRTQAGHAQHGVEAQRPDRSPRREVSGRGFLTEMCGFMQTDNLPRRRGA